MSKNPPNLTVALNLLLHLRLNLAPHKLKLPLPFPILMLPMPKLRLPLTLISMNPPKLLCRQLNLPSPDKLPRRMRHECREAREHDYAPGNL